ncbi:MAG: N-glycosylase/DNA lyase [Candidatus Aenigmatarchaeota archaeon]
MNLIYDIKKLIPLIGDKIKKKLNSFSKSSNLKENEIFLELCFCILVANNSIKNAQKVWNKINIGFLTLSESELSKKIKENHGRFYNKRAKYIVEARKRKSEIYKIIKQEKNEMKLREWLVKNINGIGMKEASHFLRNLGFRNFAILDRHVLKILKKYKIINDIPKSLSMKKYVEIENKLKEIANKIKISQAELDIYLFYLDSGKICEK